MLIKFKDLPKERRDEVGAELLHVAKQSGYAREVRAKVEEMGVYMTEDAIAKYTRSRGVTVSVGPIPEPISIEDIAAAEENKKIEEALAKHQAHLERIELERSLRESTKEAVLAERFRQMTKDALLSFEPIPFIPLADKDTSKPEHKWLLVFSDWHVGQHTTFESTGGLYMQNLAVTTAQVEKLLRAARSIHETESHGQTIKEIMVLFLGDLVENDIMRISQLRQTEFPVMQQMVETYGLVCHTLRHLITFPGIEKITAHFVGGNHDRNTTKPGNAGLSEGSYTNNYSWGIGELVQRSFDQSGERRVEIINSNSFFDYTWYAGKRLVFEHGASIKIGQGSYGGIPWYPVHNGGVKYQNMLDGADLFYMGHLHTPAVLPLGSSRDEKIILNGSLPGTTEYVQSSFKAIRVPSQWLNSFHEDHGLTGMHELKAIPDFFLKEGEAWDLAKVRQEQLLNGVT